MVVRLNDYGLFDSLRLFKLIYLLLLSGRGEREATARARAAGLPSGGDQQQGKNSMRPAIEVPYLLLDVREQDEYSKVNISLSI